MISYFDHVRTGWEPTWYDSVAVSQALQEVQAEYGDTAHTRGRPDYLIREVINQATPDVEEDVANHFFVIAVDDSGVSIIEKVAASIPDTVARYGPDGDWLHGVALCFRGFRERLAAVTL